MADVLATGALLMFGALLTQAASTSPIERTTTEPKTSLRNVLVLRGVTVFESRSGRMLPDQTIVIRGERIESVPRAFEITANKGEYKAINPRPGRDA